MSTLQQARDIADQYRADPHEWARAKEAAGGLVLANELTGLGAAQDGKKQFPAVLSVLPLVLFGLLFMAIGFFSFVTDFEGDAETTGTVTDVTRSSSNSTHHHRRRHSSSSRNKTRCTLAFTYTVNGTTYSNRTDSSNAYCRTDAGDEVLVEYLSAKPSESDVPKGDGWGMLLFSLIGTGIFGAGLWGARRHVATAIGGARLHRAGRAEALQHPDVHGRGDEVAADVTAQVLTVLQASRRKNKRRDTDDDDATDVTDATGAADAVSQAAPSVPPPGWYPTADGLHERYWDGINWSTHARPVTGPA